MVSFDLVPINNGRVMRIAGRADDEDSVIDLAVVSPVLAPICQCGVLGYHGSDRCLCTILVERGTRRQQ